MNRNTVDLHMWVCLYICRVNKKYICTYTYIYIHTHTHIYIYILLPWWLRWQKYACNAGDQVQSLGWEDPLEKGMATHSNSLVWRITLIEKPGRLWAMGSQRVRHNRNDLAWHGVYVVVCLHLYFIYFLWLFPVSHSQYLYSEKYSTLWALPPIVDLTPSVTMTSMQKKISDALHITGLGRQMAWNITNCRT